jgi:hypothetical protein
MALVSAGQSADSATGVRYDSYRKGASVQNAVCQLTGEV